MRLASALLLSALVAVPAAAQDRGQFLLDFAPGHERERAAQASRVVYDAGDIYDAAVVFCSTTDGDTGLAHRRATMDLLVAAGADRHRLLDAGPCTAQISGHSRAYFGADKVWLSLTTVTVLDNFIRERRGL